MEMMKDEECQTFQFSAPFRTVDWKKLQRIHVEDVSFAKNHASAQRKLSAVLSDVLYGSLDGLGELVLLLWFVV